LIGGPDLRRHPPATADRSPALAGSAV